MVQAARRDNRVPGHGPVCPVTESDALWAQIVFAGAAVDTFSADRGSGLRNHTIAILEPANALAGSRDASAELMPENNRGANGPALSPVILVNVAPADADCANLEQDIIFSRLRHRKLAQLYRFWREVELYDCQHSLIHRL